LNQQRHQSDTSPHAHPNSEKPTLLLVDDDTENMEILASLLRQEYDVLSANSGQQAISTIGQERIDLVLLDVYMPSSNGYEVCERLKASRATVNIPVIFVTACVGIEDEIRGLRLGAADYVTKPVRLPVLRARIKSHLDLRRQMKALELASFTDGLTGLANRLQLNQILEREWLSMLRRQEPLSLILIDIDHFKLYNDCYGHLRGDEALVRVAHAIASCQRRPEDTIGRFGGEEFLVVLPNTGLRGAAQVAARMQQSVQYLQLPHARSPVADIVTISLGVASHQQKGKRGDVPLDVMSLLNEADQCLYTAKSRGRNQYCIADSG
jgi:diguanylate cyclase (GGDEF)-like protein